MSFEIESITLENFRRFEAPITLADLQPGLNLITGPNGAGKSTIALALRKLFFLYHRSKAAAVTREMVPWSSPGSSPRVAARFLVDGKEHVFTKQWMKGAFARLDTSDGSLDGDEAEHAVATLLGFEAATRGESQIQGVPGLLWVEQGAGPDLGTRVEPAAGYLRDALGSAMGEVASTNGDELLAGLEQALGELRRKGSDTASKGPLAHASAQLAALRDEIGQLETKLSQYRERVDELAALQLACAADQRDKPWLTYQQQADQTRLALGKLEALQVQAGSEQAALETLDARIALIQAEIRRGEQFRAAVRERTAADADANERLASAIADHERAHKAVLAARERLQQAERAVESSRIAQRIGELEKRKAQLIDECSRQQSRIDQASACTERLRTIRASLSAYLVTEAELEQLRQWDQEIARLVGRAAAAATRLDFKLSTDEKVRLDGRPMAGDQQATLVKTGILKIDGIGEVSITPGGTELEDSERARLRLENDRRGLLLKLGLESTSVAAAHFEKRRQLLDASQNEAVRLADFAPDGLEQLADQLRGSQHELEQLDRELSQRHAQSVPGGDAAAGASAPGDPGAFESAQAQWQRAIADERRLGDIVAQATVRAEHTAQETAAARQSLAQWHRSHSAPDASESGSPASFDQQLTRLESERAECRAGLSALQRSIAAADPASLSLDLRRYSDSAAQSREQAERREARRDLLAARLSEAGAAGLEESLKQALAQEQRWARRESALTLRAQALAWLVGQINARRQALTERLQAPLRERMNHYLKTLLPGASLKLGTDLLPSVLVPERRQGCAAAAPGQEPVNEQSFGTREQLALLARLGYADLLAQAGRPTFLLLDDGLLNADIVRLEQIKRMLYDAAQRHQILIFSCHPDRWSGLGVAARELSDTGFVA